MKPFMEKAITIKMKKINPMIMMTTRKMKKITNKKWKE